MTQAQRTIEKRLAIAWPARAAGRLAQALHAAGPGSVVALDFDNTCIRGDFGEQLHAALCEGLAYALDDERFWSTIAPADGRERLGAAWRDRPQGQARAALVADLMAVYLRRLRRAGVEDAYGWAATLHAGLRVDALQSLARSAFDAARSAPESATEMTAPDGLVVRRPTGLRLRPALRALVDAADRTGLATWIVTATNEWAVAAVAHHVGVPPERVVGNRCVVRDGTIEVERDGPTTWRSGKVEAIDARIGRRPAVAVGDTWTDVEMLDAAEQLGVLIDRGDVELRRLAEQRGWLIVAAEALDQAGST